MSLRDELLKAGLISKEKANKSAVKARKLAHKARKDKTFAAQEAARHSEEERQRRQELERQRERDQALSRQRELQREQRERRMRVRQLIASHRLNAPDAQILYNFVADERFIRYVKVTLQQQKQLTRGLIGIAVNDENPYDFSLISRETALKLATLCPEMLLVLHSQDDSAEIQDEIEN